MGKKLLSHFFNEDRGQVFVLTALLILVILGITAFTTDIGLLQSEKRHLQNTADAAALAGARDLLDEKEDAIVKASVYDYVRENGVDENEVKAIGIVGKRVKVELEGSRGLFFARVLGFSSSKVGARATAAAGPAGGMKGVMPIGIAYGAYTDLNDGSDTFIIEKKVGNAGGNWGWLNLEYAYDKEHRNVDNGEQSDHIVNGFDKMLYAEQIVLGDTGANVQAGGHIDEFLYKLETYRISGVTLYIPIINKWDNGKSDLTIKGFAAIKIVGYSGNNPAQFTITAEIDKDASILPDAVLNPYPDPDYPELEINAIGLVE